MDFQFSGNNIKRQVRIAFEKTHNWATPWQNQQTNMCSQRRLGLAWASAQSDQSSLCAQWVAKDPCFLNADSEDSDQAGQMPRLILVFAGRTCHFVGFVTMRLIFALVSSTANFSEDLLEKHECEVARLKEYYDTHKEILSKVGHREELFKQMIEFEVGWSINIWEHPVYPLLRGF